MKDITIEEAIKMLQQEIDTDKQNLPIAEANEYEEERKLMLSRISATEKVLNELEKYKELYVRTLGHTLNNSIAQSDKLKDDLEALNEGWKIELEKKDKIIDAMAKEIEKFGCISTEVFDSAKECMHMQNCIDCIKQYFERKVKDD